MSKPEPRKAVIHIISKFKVKKQNQAFRCVFIYQDLTTKYCIVRPLLFKLHLEIMMELFKIFTSYGPPHELLINSCTQEVVDNIEAHMKALCPMFNIKFVRRHGDNNDVAMKVVTALHKWMGKTQKDEWEVGCSIVQRKINSQIISASNLLSPHDLFFNYGKIDSTNKNDVANKKDVPNKISASNNDNANEKWNPAVRKNLRNVKTYSGKHQSANVEKHSANVEKHSANVEKHSANVEKRSTNVEEHSTNAVKHLNTVKVKKEIEDSKESFRLSVSEQMVVLDGGLQFPTFNLNLPDIEVKLERLDE